MKVTCFLPLFLLLLPYRLDAQDDVPKDIPLQGKVLSHEIFKAYGDSLTPKESPVEKATYDKNGRILEITKGSIYMGGRPFVKKYIYTSDKEIIYECKCKDIERFVKEFVIRNRNELKNKPSYGTPQEPTHWVTINTRDKKGNVIHSAHYSRSGYRTQDIWFEYTATNNLRTKTVYDMDSVVTLSEKSSYDARGNLTEKIVKHKDAPASQEILVYDTQNNLLEKRYFEHDKLRIHLEYSVKVMGTTKEFITTDRLRDSSYVEKIITYNIRNQEIKRQEFELWGESPRVTQWEYFENGNIKSISYYNEEGNLQRKAEYEYDRHNNWIVAHISQLVTILEKGTKRDEIQKITYVQKITYH